MSNRSLGPVSLQSLNYNFYVHHLRVEIFHKYRELRWKNIDKSKTFVCWIQVKQAPNELKKKKNKTCLNSSGEDGAYILPNWLISPSNCSISAK